MAVITSVSGFPRIGRNRELKKVIEGYWKGRQGLDDVRQTARQLRTEHWELQRQAGIDLIPSNDFSYYDQLLDTAVLLNIIPQRYQRLSLSNPEDTLFAMARGYQGERGDVTALPMKKWFTTNYHYLVPLIDEGTQIRLNGTILRPRRTALKPSQCSLAHTPSSNLPGMTTPRSLTWIRVWSMR